VFTFRVVTEAKEPMPTQRYPIYEGQSPQPSFQSLERRWREEEPDLPTQWVEEQDWNFDHSENRDFVKVTLVHPSDIKRADPDFAKVLQMLLANDVEPDFLFPSSHDPYHYDKSIVRSTIHLEERIRDKNYELKYHYTATERVAGFYVISKELARTGDSPRAEAETASRAAGRDAWTLEKPLKWSC
jgi:hypothetical protein